MALSLLDAHLAKCAPPVAECLNARYQRGTPTADPEAAGVFITQFDKARPGGRKKLRTRYTRIIKRCVFLRIYVPEN